MLHKTQLLATTGYTPKAGGISWPLHEAIRRFPTITIRRNAHLAMLQQDVPFFLRQLPRKKQQILELAVGSGRAAIPMAQAGHRVVGIDYDPNMLEIARQKRDSVGLSDRDLQLLHHSALKLKLPDRFDWICIFFNTFLGFTELEEQDQLLKLFGNTSSRAADSGWISSIPTSTFWLINTTPMSIPFRSTFLNSTAP